MSNDRESFNPFISLFKIRVAAVLNGIYPDSVFRTMGLDTTRIRIKRDYRRNNTKIPCGISPKGWVMKPDALTPNYYLVATEEFRERDNNKKSAQVVADNQGKMLKAAGFTDRQGNERLSFSANQSRVFFLVRAHETNRGNDYCTVHKIRLEKKETGNQLSADRIFPAEDSENNGFSTFFHITPPHERLKTVRERSPKELEFLAEAITAAFEKVHADKDGVFYAELLKPRLEPKKENETQEGSAKTSPETTKDSTLEKAQNETREGFKNTILADPLEGLKKKPSEPKKSESKPKPKPRSKSKSKK